MLPNTKLFMTDVKGLKVKKPNPWLEALKWAFWIFALGSLFLLLGYSEVIPKVIF